MRWRKKLACRRAARPLASYRLCGMPVVARSAPSDTVQLAANHLLLHSNRKAAGLGGSLLFAGCHRIVSDERPGEADARVYPAGRASPVPVYVRRVTGDGALREAASSVNFAIFGGDAAAASRRARGARWCARRA